MTTGKLLLKDIKKIHDAIKKFWWEDSIEKKMHLLNWDHLTKLIT